MSNNKQSLNVGQTLTVKLPALSSMPATTEIVPVADSAARSMEIRLETDAQTGLMPGLYAQLQLPLATEKGC